MEMLSFHFDKVENVPLYEQLYAHIKQEIIDGRLPFQAKLPSKRNLADFLQLSQTTIEMSYQQLVAEGYIEAIPRKGYFVLAFEDLAYVKKDQIGASKTDDNTTTARFNFHPSKIDTSPFPFHRWRKHAKDVIDERHQDLLLLGHFQGDLVLREEISTYLYHSRGVRCTADQVVIGAGIEHLLPQLIFLLGKEAVYGIEDPGYRLTRHVLRAHDKKTKPIEVDSEGVKVRSLVKTNANVMYVTPSHQFPSGNILSVNRRVQLLNWAAETKNRYIIEDDYDSEFRYSGKPIPSLQSMDQGENVIYLSTFSKSLMPSLRIGYMVLPPALLAQYQKTFRYYTSSVSRIDQHILARFMQEGDFEKHLNRMRKLYRKKLELLMDILRQYPNTLQVTGESAGLHILLTVHNGMTEETLIKKAKDQEILVYGLSEYTINTRPSDIPQIVLGFAGIKEEELATGIDELLHCWGIS
ncbi:PLP-dependent aminotransferase family protein [Jeotgalibacillus soli]|uniref:Transcriptional regulator n=1 Tax=Jeotgalibacillus soli TaxID=889306 RepID=A0A0C2W9C8_9BACL|nr:PLP-dependent aminotransferase family protein [Jeotgalibacillus soli]KIL52633.1 transcriptional regulator [Jeotgalibacillus soli]